MLRTITMATAALTLSVAGSISLAGPAGAGEDTQIAQGAGSTCPAGLTLRFIDNRAPTARKWVCNATIPARCPVGYFIRRGSSVPFHYSCMRNEFSSPASCPAGWQFFNLSGRCMRTVRLSCPTGYLATRFWVFRRDTGHLGASHSGRPFCYRPLRAPNRYPVCPAQGTYRIDRPRYVRPRYLDTCRSRSNPNVRYPICTGVAESRMIIRRSRDLCIETATASR